MTRSEASSDRELATRADGGDELALNALLRRHWATLQGYVRRRLGRGLRARVESSDVLQNAFVDAVRGFAGAPVRDTEFVPWMERVVERTIRDEARFHGRQKRAHARETAWSADSTLQPASPATSPSAGCVREEERQALARAMAELPAADRELIRLARIHGKTAAEVAALLGKTQEAAKRAITRALTRLARIMADRQATS